MLNRWTAIPDSQARLLHAARWAIGLLLALLVTGCGGAATEGNGAAGGILLWHSMREEGGAALAETVNTFSELNPGVEIFVRSFVDEEEMLDVFLRSSDSGLGPDLLLGPSVSILGLAEAGAIRNISAWMTPEIDERYMAAALQSIVYDGRHMGLPLSTTTEVLYYNQELVAEPAATLADLMSEASSGNYVAMNSSFGDSFWGIQAFGGRLFSEDGEVLLGQGGYANWLEWLKTARDAPGFVLDTDRDFLQQQFVDGAAAYYVGESTEFPDLVAAMGDRVRVAKLPSGPVGSAGPFLTSEAFLFNSASSPAQTDLAVALALFITNGEQSAALMRSGAIIPANRSVRINPRLNPNVSVMAEQARNAIPLPNLDLRSDFIGLADDAQRRVLEGLVTANEAATATALVIGEELGLAVATPEPVTCEVSGSLVVANALTGAVAEAFVQLTDAYTDECPDFQVQVINLTADQVVDLAENGVADYRELDLILGDQRLLTRLVAAERILEISPWIDDERLQTFAPSAINAVRLQNGLYAAPFAVDLNALYFNRNLVEQPARSLDELVRQRQDGVPLVLEATFNTAFWGISALSDQPPAADFLDSLDPQGLVAWLDWLASARRDTRLDLVFRHEVARLRFIEGRTAYYVGSFSEYAGLRRAMLPDAVGAQTLPSGPGGDASPILHVSGFMLPDHATTERVELTRSYMRYLVAPENQLLLAETAGLLPVNTGTDLSTRPIVAAFVDQMRTATVYPNLPDVEEALDVGDALYRNVLENGVEPAEVVSDTISLMYSIMGVEAPVDARSTAEP